MKLIGALLITLGLALLIFIGISLLQSGNHLASPIPEEKGVKVIFVTPQPTQ